MIIVNLKGGTGNQLFQYALGRHLALKNNDVLKLDIDGLVRANETGDIYRPFNLEAFALEKNLASEEEVRALKYPYGIVSKGWRFIRFKLLRDKNTTFHPAVLNWTGDIFLDGYWQSPRYFDEIRDVLLQDLQLKDGFGPAAERFAGQIRNNAAVSLHVRRGDYVKNPRVLKECGICSVDYYKAAMAHIEATAPSPTYFIFSDDIAWVKEHLPVGDRAVFVQGPDITDVEELMLMSLCQHNIIANSSFSWWGAWLNQHEDKVVVAPTPWFNASVYDRDLIPPSWIQLPK